MTDGASEETDDDRSGTDNVSADTAESSGGDEDDGSGTILRRDVLVGGGTLTLGAGVAYWLVSGDDPPSSNSTPEQLESDPQPSDDNLPFSIWQDIRAGLQDSPDHLPGTAEDIIARGDPKEIFAFVRDEIATQPPSPSETSSSPFIASVNGGSRAALRSGMGTPREKAELLATLLGRAGYEADVLGYNRGITEDQLRELYFGAVSHEFDPGFDREQLSDWRQQLGSDNGGSGDSEREDEQADESEPTGLDPDGETSAALGERIRGAIPSGKADEFNWDAMPDGVPVVRFQPSPDEVTDNDETGSTTGEETPGATQTATSTPASGETTSETPTPDGSEVRYADLFHPDESFGRLQSPEAVEEAPDSDAPRVTITLEAAFSNEPTERRQLVTAGYDAADFAGRQLLVDTVPGISPFDYPTVRHSDVNRFIPSLGLQDPHADQETLESRSVHGDPFGVTGDRYSVDSEGTVRRNGTVVDEGQTETTFTLELPDGTERPIEPVERDPPIEKYYSYDRKSKDSAIEETVERPGETVTYLYRSNSSGKFSLVVIHNHPEKGDGGAANMTFDGVTGAQWVQLDDPDDGYETPDGIFSDTERATWDWLGAHTDGGGIGGISFPFDVGMTHHGQFRDGSRTGLDRWTFLEGDDLEPVEVAAFDEDEPEDVTIRVSGAVTESDPTGGPEAPDDLSEVATVSASVDPQRYPEIAITLEPTDSDSRAVEDLPGTAFEIAEDSERVVADLQESGPPYRFTYRSPNEREVGAERSVSVTMPGADAEDTTSYAVPASSTDPQSELGICGLYLTVEVDGDVSRRTLAGYDPELDGDSGPTDADRNETFSALFGNHVLTFESAGVSTTVHLDDQLAGKLTLEPLVDAQESGTHEAVKEAIRGGTTAVERFPQYFHPKLPDRTTDDTITYGTGLRTVLFGRRPEFGTSEVELSIDILDTSTIRTLTRNGDREREFRLTMDRTARRSVLERENLDRSTGSLLADATLVPAADIGDEWSDTLRQQFEVAQSRRPISDDTQVVGTAGDTAAFWNVEAGTGAVTGILPDGSGGGDAVAEIREDLERINQVADAMGLYLDGAAAAGVGGGALGVVAQIYGKVIAKLYAISSIAIATMDASKLGKQAVKAVVTFACNMALNMELEWAAGALGEIATTANSISGATGGNTFGC